MSPQIFALLLSVSGTIILLLLGIVGYFLRQNIDVIKDLKETIQDFREEYIATKENVIDINLKCGERNLRVDKRLDAHDEKLQEHTVEITKLKVKYGKD